MNIPKDKTTVIAIAAIGSMMLLGYANVQQANSNKMLSMQVEKLNSQLEHLSGKSVELQQQVDVLAQKLTPKPQQLVASR